MNAIGKLLMAAPLLLAVSGCSHEIRTGDKASISASSSQRLSTIVIEYDATGFHGDSALVLASPHGVIAAIERSGTYSVQVEPDLGYLIVRRNQQTSNGPVQSEESQLAYLKPGSRYILKIRRSDELYSSSFKAY